MEFDLPKNDENPSFLEGKLYSDKSNIFLRSEQTQDIIAEKGHFIENSALFIFLLILIAILIGTWYIKYPDIIVANALLTAQNAPKEIVARQDGKIIRLFVGNDSTVKKDQTIAWIESTADHHQVLKLSVALDSAERLLSQDLTEQVSRVFKEDFQNLGELQVAHQIFKNELQRFNDYLVNGYYYNKKKELVKDCAYLEKIHQSIETQKLISLKDLSLMEESIDANKSLYNDKVISKQDFRDLKGKLLSKQLIIPQLQSVLISNENTQMSKRQEIFELEHTIILQKDIFKQAIETLSSLINEWKKKYLILAPEDGKAIFLFPVQQNQYLQAGKTLGFVDPPDTKYYAQILLPQLNLGKIQIGQNVQLRFDSYQYQEFGYVLGKLDYISKISTDSGFLARVNLPYGLRTNYRKTIQYRSGLKSQALILTTETRLLQRLFFNFTTKISLK